MPSKLNTSTARGLQARGFRKQAQAAIAGTLQVLDLRGPFSGFLPDVDPNLLDATALVFPGKNVLARAYPGRGEVLTLPDGYRQVDQARLPLGDGATLPASPVTDGKTIVRLDNWGRFSPTGATHPGEYAAEFIATPVAATAGTGTADTGNLYRIASTNQWTRIAPAASMAAATRQLSATRDGRTASKSMPDSCIAPFGATARARNTAGADDRQSGGINEPAFLFTNDVDEVMVAPSNSGAVDGTTAGPPVHAYEPLCDHISSVDLDSGGANGFRCKSLETWNGRVYFFNTDEANVRRPLRLRRTAKFTCDPLTTNPGAGFYDFREFQGEGVRIETLGDVLAVYATDGVAFMRPTGNPTSPDEPQIISTERGLLGTHAMVSIGRNVHFGIFTDGWWLLDQSGRWQQAGVSNINNKEVSKWRQSFYSDLPSSQRHRIYCYYDSPNNLVYIARPTVENAEPAEVWIYDPAADRLAGIENYAVSCFGSFTPLTQAGTIIDSLTGTIDSLSGTIDSFGPVVGFPKARVHGDQTGFVYSHSRDQTGFQSASNPTATFDPDWRVSIGMRGMRDLLTLDRVSLEYYNRNNNQAVSVTVAGPSADGSQSIATTFTGGNAGDLRSRDFWLRYTSQSPGLTISGTGDFQIRAAKLDVWGDAIEPRGL